MRLYKNLIMLLLCLCCSLLQGQILDKKITLEYNNVSMAEALKKIKTTYGINFSYVNSTISTNRKVSIKANNTPLKEVLDKLFASSGISYLLVGDQVVLKKEAKAKPSRTTTSPPLKKDTAGSYNAPQVNDPEDATAAQTTLPDTSAHMADVKLMPIQVEPLAKPGDTLTRRELRQRYRAEKRKLKYKYGLQKDNVWRGESMFGPNSKDRLHRAIEDLRKEMHNLERQIEKSSQKSLPYILPDSGKTTASDSSNRNSREQQLDSLRSTYIYDPFQITFISPLGTDGMQCGRSVNHVSINILGGYAAGLQGVEYGGFVNVEKDFVHGVQFVGFANIVGNKVQGAQFSGFMNINGGYAKGVQYAGFININRDSIIGVQGAGFCNVSGSVRGAQLAGFCNVSKGSVKGLQAAGFCNTNAGKMKGVQVAGFANVNTDSLHGSQFAGFANICNNNVKGTQIAGFINVARKMKGAQIGVINIADSLDGAAIGIISIVRKNGYRRLEMYTSESMYANIAYKMGVRAFYNIFYVGGQLMNNYYRWGWGYGVGTEFDVAKRMAINIDALSIQLNENEAYTNKLNLLNQLKVNFSFGLTDRVSVFAGPSYNVQVSQFVNKDNTIGSNIVNHGFYNVTTGPTNVKMWIGFNGGIRF